MPGSPVLLDLDGTLIDSLADIAASANHVRVTFGLEPLDSAIVQRMIGDGARKLLERALAEAASPPTLADALQVFDEHHAEQCTREVRLYPRVTETLRIWQDRGTPLALVTNKPERFARRILEHLSIDDAFDAVLGGDTIAERKPSPAPLHEAIRRLGCDPSEAVMIGDGLQDLQAGKAAGMRTIGCLYGFRDPDELRQEGADAFWTHFGG